MRIFLDNAVLVDTNTMNSFEKLIGSWPVLRIHLQHRRHKAHKRNAVSPLITQLPDQPLLESGMLCLLEHDDVDLVTILLVPAVIPVHN